MVYMSDGGYLWEVHFYIMLLCFYNFFTLNAYFLMRNKTIFILEKKSSFT